MEDRHGKDYAAFESGGGVCYRPELSDTEYTRDDFIRLAGGDVALAHRLFSLCEWQHPETLLEESRDDGTLEAI